jgi:RNase P subunit RPR2
MDNIIICKDRETCLICGGELIPGEAWEIVINDRYFTNGYDATCSKCGREHSLETSHHAINAWGEYDLDYEDSWGGDFLE